MQAQCLLRGGGIEKWCLGTESNRHSFRNRILSPARLPVPPPRQVRDSTRILHLPRLCYIQNLIILNTYVGRH